jgi:hypothetical protein
MKKGINIKFTNESAPSSSEKWRSMDEFERISILNSALKSYNNTEKIDITKAHLDGQVTITLTEIMTASERGGFLLDIEEFLKNRVDVGITIWHEPIGDKNSLRNLRGIEVVSNEEFL